MEENKIRQNMIDKLIKGLGVSLAKTPLVLLLKNKTDYSQKRVLHGNFFLCVFCCLSFVTEGSTQNTGNVCFFACFCSIENQLTNFMHKLEKIKIYINFYDCHLVKLNLVMLLQWHNQN